MTDLIGDANRIGDLERDIRIHFSQKMWRLSRLEFPEKGETDQRVLAFPAHLSGEEIDDELDEGDISEEFYEGFREISEKYGISLAIPCSVYLK